MGNGPWNFHWAEIAIKSIWTAGGSVAIKQLGTELITAWLCYPIEILI